MKFKYVHKIVVIHKKLLLLFNLLRGPDITHSEAGSGPLIVHPCCINKDVITPLCVRLL